MGSIARDRLSPLRSAAVKRMREPRQGGARGLGRIVAGVLTALAATVVPVLAEIPVVELAGVITTASADETVAGLESAHADGAPLVVLRIDTPGGLNSAARKVTSAILASRVPVAAFVGPPGARAAGAGFVVLASADVVAMAPGTYVGAAGGSAPLSAVDGPLADRIRADIAAEIEAAVGRRGRSIKASRMTVYAADAYSDRQALEQRVVDLVVKDEAALVESLDQRVVTRVDGSSVRLSLKGQRIRVVSGGLRRWLRPLADPALVVVWMVVGAAGLLAQIALAVGAALRRGVLVLSPLFWLPGALGAWSLAMMLWSTGSLASRPLLALTVAIVVTLTAIGLAGRWRAGGGTRGGGTRPRPRRPSSP